MTNNDKVPSISFSFVPKGGPLVFEVVQVSPNFTKASLYGKNDIADHESAIDFGIRCLYLLVRHGIITTYDIYSAHIPQAK